MTRETRRLSGRPDWPQLGHMRLRNFRDFSDTGSVDFAPLTLLFGKNSSGKTSLLRAPLLLRQLTLRSSASSELALSGPDVDFGAYRDLVRDRDLTRDIWLSFGLEGGRESLPTSLLGADRLQSLLAAPSMTLHLHWNKRSGQAQFESIVANTESGEPGIELRRDGLHRIAIKVPPLNYATSIAANPPLSLNALNFLNIAPTDAKSRIARTVDFALFALADTFRVATSRLVHIPPLRDMPERAYRLDVAATGTISSRTVAVMAQQAEATKLASTWMKMLGIADDVALSRVAPGFANIVLTLPGTRLRVNLADVGFGASQVLPILVILASAIQGSTILIEHPELHLHPSAVSELADVLIDAARSRKHKLVIETHSEHLFLRLRRRVAEGAIDVADLNAYVVEKGAIRTIPMDASGQINARSLPEGFFEEEWEEATALAKASAKSKT